MEESTESNGRIADVAGARPQLESVERKALLGRSEVEYSEWAVNHVSHCAHDCVYCYARAGSKATGKIQGDGEWVEVGLVLNSAEMLADELARKRKLPSFIFMCFMSDPFMYDAASGCGSQEVRESTFEVIRVANDAGVPVTTLTKGVYPDVLPSDFDERNQYGITVVSVNEEFREEWEPEAAPHIKRIESLRRLSDAGAHTWISIEPYPTSNIDLSAGDPSEILEAASFVDKVIFGRMNYRPEVTEYLREDATYYERASESVSAWCAEHGKMLHIKASTPGHSPHTVGILSPDYGVVLGEKSA